MRGLLRASAQLPRPWVAPCACCCVRARAGVRGAGPGSGPRGPPRACAGCCARVRVRRRPARPPAQVTQRGAGPSGPWLPGLRARGGGPAGLSALRSRLAGLLPAGPRREAGRAGGPESSGAGPSGALRPRALRTRCGNVRRRAAAGVTPAPGPCPPERPDGCGRVRLTLSPPCSVKCGEQARSVPGRRPEPATGGGPRWGFAGRRRRAGPCPPVTAPEQAQLPRLGPPRGGGASGPRAPRSVDAGAAVGSGGAPSGRCLPAAEGPPALGLPGGRPVAGSLLSGDALLCGWLGQARCWGVRWDWFSSESAPGVIPPLPLLWMTGQLGRT